jgi:mRNA interferase MazF
LLYIPQSGDIIYMNFTPNSGHEQGGKRPAVVVSNEKFHEYTNMAIVCPISNTDRPFPLHVPLDNRTRTTGFIKCEQVKSLDYIARNAEYVERLPQDIFSKVLKRIKASIT